MNELQKVRNFFAEMGIETTLEESEGMVAIFMVVLDFMREKIKEDEHYFTKMDELTTDEKQEMIDLFNERGLQVDLWQYDMLKSLMQEMKGVM